MATQASTAVARCTRPLLAYNRSGGYRWNPIPKPPPPHYDRLYGVHSVLNTLRVAAQRQQREYIDSIRETAATRGATSAGEGAFNASLPHISHPSKAATPASLLHPHRAHLACLYVRDFSLEEGGEGVEELDDDDTVASVAVQMTNDTNAAPRAERRSHLPARGRSVHRKKVIPRRYTAVCCITALAKSLKVPIRFVPRAELVQLCGERRNQNIVLEASSYKPYPIKHLGEIWGAGATAAAVAAASTTTTRGVVSAPTNDSAGGLITVLFLEHIIDPTNIGGILRTAFFFGVDHVVLSRQCAACTAAVSRTSTGFLEHLRVYQATTSSAAFLRASKQAWASRTSSPSSTTIALTGLEVIASAVVAASTTAKQRDAGESVVASQLAASNDSVPPGVNPESGYHGAHACAQERQHCLPAVRLLLLGNEDSGLPPDLLQWCTHVAHVRSPRQTRLSLARTSTQGGLSHRNRPGECGANADVDDTDAQLSVSHLDSAAVPSVASAETFDKHQHNLRRLARLRDKEVSLNVNTATAALLSALCGVVRPLGESGGQLGLVLAMRMTASPHVLRVAACLCTIFGDELFPVIIWLSMFGATRLAPALVPRLSMAFPQVMDVPRLLPWQRRRGVCDGASSRVVAGANSISVAADAAAARLAELIRQTPFGTRSDSVDLGSDISSGTCDAALRASWWPIDHQFLELLVSLVTYPRRLWTYILFRRSQPASLRNAASAAHRGRNVRSATLELLLRTMTSFTSTWVHASGNMLFNTLVTYLSARIGSWGSGSVMSGGDRRHNGFRNGWRDLLVASCVSTGLNLLLQTYWVEALTSFGELRALSVEVTDGHASSPSFSGRMQLLSSAFSRLGGIESLYHLSRLALRMQPNQSSGAFEGERVNASPPSSSSSSGAGLPQLNRVVSSSQTTSLTPARAQAQSHPAHVYLCGGSVFIFALSGFRFTYYNDPQQLTTAVSNFMTDALSLVLRQAQKRAAAQNGHVAGALLEEQVWRPPVSSSSSNHDVVLAPVASLQLLPLHVLNFAVGAGVGLAWRERRLLVALRRVPLLRHIVELMFPLPPLPLKLPEVLQELSPERHVLLVQPGGKVEVTTDALPSLPIVKADTPDLATATVTPSRSSADDLPSSGVTSIVVAQDLFCPIKRTLMCDPVQTVDGFTYDRDGIEEWLWAHDTAPLTNLHLDSMALRVNWQARQKISRLVDQYTAAVASSGGGQ